jgi:class 3 adenylate cyclase
MSAFAGLPDWLGVVGTIIGVLTPIIGLTVYVTRLKIEGTRKLREAELELGRQRTTIGALEASAQALSQTVALLREGKEHAANVLMEIDRLMAEGRQSMLAVGDSILIRDPYGHDSMVFLAIHGDAADRIKRLKIPVRESVAGTVLTSGVATVYPTEHELEQRYETTDVKSGFRSESMLTLPLIYSGQVIGVLQYVNRLNGAPFTRADIEKVRALCDELAVRVQRIVNDSSALKLLGITESAEVAEGSFLFLDLSRSTTLFQAMPTHEVASLLNEYYDRLIGLALRDGAMLDRLLGDGMLIRVNVPRRVPDFPTVAVRCALSMQAEFQAMQTEWLRIGRRVEGLDHRIGIATGHVTAGLMGHPDFLTYTVLGAPVNRAARLCQVARMTHSGIAICRTTYDAVRDSMARTATFASIAMDAEAYEVSAVSLQARMPAAVPAGGV